jgi:hypothetical protein
LPLESLKRQHPAFVVGGSSWKRSGLTPSSLCIIEGGNEAGRAVGSLAPVSTKRKAGGFPMMAASRKCAGHSRNQAAVQVLLRHSISPTEQISQHHLLNANPQPVPGHLLHQTLGEGL